MGYASENIYRVSRNEWTPHNTKYSLLLIVLCKSYEIFPPWLGLNHLFATSKPNTPFQNGSIEAKKGARQKFVHFWKALTILMLKKYLKS